VASGELVGWHAVGRRQRLRSFPMTTMTTNTTTMMSRILIMSFSSLW
jgi:hypothetical protein